MLITFLFILFFNLPCLSQDEKKPVSGQNEIFDEKIIKESKTDDFLIDFMFIRNLHTSCYYTQEINHLIQNQEGTNLSKKNNLYLFEDGYLAISQHFRFFYAFREYFDRNGIRRIDSIDYKNSSDYFVHRIHTEFDIWKLYIKGGIDNNNFGPAQNGLILSDNTAPYLMAATGTSEPINLFGKWDYTIMHAWLRENRYDWNDPMFAFFRISYSPFDFIKIGLSRFIMYGGTGEPIGGKKRPSYGSAGEYYKLLIGPEEKIPGGNYDNAAYSGFDLQFNIPVQSLIKWIDSFTVYYEYSTEDMVAPWYVQGSESSGVKFNIPAYQWGLLLKTGRQSFRLEYTAISKYFYTHHEYYEEGHSFRGVSLGHPAGRNSKTLCLTYTYKFNNTFFINSTFGITKQPAFDSAGISTMEYFNFTELFTKAEYFRMKKYYLTLSPQITLSSLTINPYLCMDIVTHIDENPMPHQYTIFDESRTLFSFGISISYRIGDFLRLKI